MQDIASKRRDNVALFKKLFLFVKLLAMLALSVAGSLFFVWKMFKSQWNSARHGEVYFPDNFSDCLKYCDENKILVISSVICCVLACAFVAFLAFHGIQFLVVKFMMRKANTGG